MSSQLHLQQSRRAPRIPSEEWDKHKSMLTRLFLEQDQSYKDIIRVMKDHKFPITMKQLKHRFHRWGVKKYISDTDMAIMLSLRHEHLSAGQDVRFECKGHPVKPERLQLALKRRREPLIPPTSIPSHINMSVISDRPSLDVANSIEVNPGIPNEPSNLFMEEQHFDSLGYGGEAGSSSLDAPFDGLEFSEPHCSQGIVSDLLETSLERITFPKPFDSNDTMDFQRDGHETSHLELHGPASESTCASDFDFSKFVDLSRHGSPSSQTSNPTDVASQCLSDQFRALHSDVEHSLSVLTRTIAPPGHVEERPTQSPELLQGIEAIGEYGMSLCDPEAIVDPLNFMNSHLSDSLNYALLDWCTFNGPTLSELLELVHSKRLSLEVEGLLCDAMEAHSKAIRRRQRGANTNRWSDKITEPALSEIELASARRRALEDYRGHALQTKNSSYLLSVTSRGVLRIEYLVTAEENHVAGSQRSTYVLKIFSLPKARRRVTGVLVTFDHYKRDSLTPRLYPYIQTFNVIPQDSQIIQYVSRNDVQGARRLFDANLASPLDVDPCGFSLLSYAMYTGYSEVFRLLLQGGADMQNCDRYGMSLDVVWAIWATYADYHSQLLLPSYYASGVKRDFDQCVRMTRAALDKGCDTDSSICYNPYIANALFEVESWWSLSEKHSPAPEKAIEFLVSIGYDLEARNSTGCTPLLHTATSQKPQVVSCLRTLIRNGANVYALDWAGRGAIHCALATPHLFDGWKNLRLTEFPQHTAQNHLFVPAYLYHTQSGAFASDYDEWRDGISSEKELIPKSTNIWFNGRVQDPEACEEEQTVIDGCECGFKASSDQEEIQNTHGYFHAAKSITCEDYAGVRHRIRHPVQILRKRLRFKLLTLLKAGCDPNLFDKAGVTPSKCARENGLWPQWTWALGEAGYEYVVGGDRWMKL